ncbi:hypothetical protein CC1G_14935 [Coprinopsis cinerea okayama7|uniref:Uncharacterized protein n=1 Tax=Coprinopsis cinerea (strain Okayama-7 / 130 / ATCC MYA-4618 / FGSC 9003) TaxID=240176 RepID=D6RNZ8_COPC7|nr:hypothetical protein CC1G_14935 [Coprinopsis cinerea okayama7\|eukprot:XP_002910604.1 hypothetical protein CC1G_14935 [Coprinopsis cinerea okayama7\
MSWVHSVLVLLLYGSYLRVGLPPVLVLPPCWSSYRIGTQPRSLDDRYPAMTGFTRRRLTLTRLPIAYHFNSRIGVGRRTRTLDSRIAMWFNAIGTSTMGYPGFVPESSPGSLNRCAWNRPPCNRRPCVKLGIGWNCGCTPSHGKACTKPSWIAIRPTNELRRPRGIFVKSVRRCCGCMMRVGEPELIHPFASAIDSPELEAPETMVCIKLDSKPGYVRLPEGKKEVYQGYGEESIEGWHKKHGCFKA